MEYLTVKETAQRWGVSVRTVNMHLNAGSWRARCQGARLARARERAKTHRPPPQTG